MADVRAKNISPLQMDDLGCEEVCEHIDDWQRPGRRSGDGVTMANVGAKYFSPVQKVICGKNVRRLRNTNGRRPGEKYFAPTN